jgi:hypothetical protein
MDGSTVTATIGQQESSFCSAVTGTHSCRSEYGATEEKQVAMSKRSMEERATQATNQTPLQNGSTDLTHLVVRTEREYQPKKPPSSRHLNMYYILYCPLDKGITEYRLPTTKPPSLTNGACAPSLPTSRSSSLDATTRRALRALADQCTP